MIAAHPGARQAAHAYVPLSLMFAAFFAAGCAASTTSSAPAPAPAPSAASTMSRTPPSPDPRIGLRSGMHDAGEAIWNLRIVSKTPPPPQFEGKINSDLAFRDNLVFQGSFGGVQIWDISNPRQPSLQAGVVCPASQSDVSVYGNLLFVSGEDMAARVDCGTQGIRDTVSAERFRGIRIMDITDVRNPRTVAVVQTCRGSHTHTVLEDPRDRDNVYIYVSGSSPVRSQNEMAGCSRLAPDRDPNSALFRIEVIRVPLRNPERAAIVSSPRIFTGLAAPPAHAAAPVDSLAAEARVAAARAEGRFATAMFGQAIILPPPFARMLLDSLVRERRGTGNPTAADSARLRTELRTILGRMFGGDGEGGARTGPNQCHDITVFPELGIAGGACEGYGLLLDIRDPVNPRRTVAVADSNFAYWHSATFNNDATTVLFTDEWGGGGGPKCRTTDRPEWGANAIFSIENGQLRFRSYYKLPAAQTETENCVAHNGSLIPVPGRDIMVQSWYQGGISIFDFTDPARPVEIAFFDRGPVDANRPMMAGSWSVYWYNGMIVSSEILRGLDILELVPSAHLSQNEIDAARSVRMTQFNPQMQERFVWQPSFAVARSYVDQLERSGGLQAARIASVRQALASAERASGAARRDALVRLASELDGEARGADAAKIRMLAGAVRDLGGVGN